MTPSTSRAVERFVYVKLKDPKERERVAHAAREAFPRIGVVREFGVGLPADGAAEVWDLVLRIRFDRYEDVAVYLDDPEHVAFVETWLAPHTEVRKAWNFRMVG